MVIAKQHPLAKQYFKNLIFRIKYLLQRKNYKLKIMGKLEFTAKQ